MLGRILPLVCCLSLLETCLSYHSLHSLKAWNKNEGYFCVNKHQTAQSSASLVAKKRDLCVGICSVK